VSATSWPQPVNELVEAADHKILTKTIARYGRVACLHRSTPKLGLCRPGFH